MSAKPPVTEPQPTLVAEVQLPSGPRASFIARRVVRALVTDAPAVRSVDAALLVSEVVTLMYQEDVTLSVRVEEIGRRGRVTTTTTTAGAVDQAEAIVPQ